MRRWFTPPGWDRLPPRHHRLGEKPAQGTRGGVAEESCTPNAMPGETREEVADHLSLPTLPPAVNRGVEGKRGGAKWSRAGGV